MRSHGAVRDVRMIGMVLVVLLLVHSVSVGVYAAGRTSPTLCFLKQNFDEDLDTSSPIGIFSVAAVVLPILGGYVTRIQDLYFGQADPLIMTLLKETLVV